MSAAPAVLSEAAWNALAVGAQCTRVDSFHSGAEWILSTRRLWPSLGVWTLSPGDDVSGLYVYAWLRITQGLENLDVESLSCGMHLSGFFPFRSRLDSFHSVSCITWWRGDSTRGARGRALGSLRL